MKKVARYGETKDVIYILVNSRDQYVIANGITFQDFIDSLENPPTYLLLLKHKFGESEYHLHTQLDYVNKEQISLLLKEDIKNYGDFCWIDFDDLFGIDSIEEEELAELLYLGHRKRHLSLPFYQKLNNRFVYLTELDGWVNKIYFRYWHDFYLLFGNFMAKYISTLKLEKSLLPFRKKKTYPSIDRAVIEQLAKAFYEGVVFSLQHLQVTRNRLEIPFWVVGDYTDMDEMIEQYEKKNRKHPSGTLVYDKKGKQWLANFPYSTEFYTTLK